MKDKVNKLLAFYGALGRPLTIMEILRFSQGEFTKINSILEKEVKNGAIIENNGFFILDKFKTTDSLIRREQDFLWDKKWQKLLCLRRWFDFLPFFDFVLVSGSMAFGNVSEKSDFDVLLGVKKGRIFIARYFAHFVFSLFDARRLDDEEGSSPDKLCFNHFVTGETFSKPPFNLYRHELYRNLIPFWGKKEVIKEFLRVNKWAEMSLDSLNDLRYVPIRKNALNVLITVVLNGKFGDFLENKIFAPIAKQRLNRYLKKRQFIGRSVVSDIELEFHFDLSGEEKFGG